MQRFRARTTALTAFAAIATILVCPRPALAAPENLGTTAGFTASAPNPVRDYAFQSRTGYWSVFGILPPAGADYDLSVSRADGTGVSSSVAGAGMVDFVAVNSNAGCPGTNLYRATVTRYSGSGDYRVGLDTGHVLPQTVNTQNPGTLTFQGNFITINDVWLEAGAKYTFLAPPDRPEHLSLFFLLGSDPADPRTCMRGRSAAIVSTTEQSAGWELTGVTVPRSGWYGAVSVAPDQQNLPIWFRQSA